MRLREQLAIVVVLSGFLLQSCSDRGGETPAKIAGSEWLRSDRGGSSFDVLAYPLNEDELIYFESMLPALESAAAKYPENWERIAEAEDPVFAAKSDSVWSEAGVSGRDVIAAMLKLTFLREFGASEESLESELKQNLAWLEERLKGAEDSAELQQTANSLRALIKVVEAHREANAFSFYASNQARIDAALDRFTAIGEE